MPDFLASRQTQIESLVLFPPCLLGKESKMMLWNASCLKPLVIPQAQDDLEAIYVAYFAQDQFVQEKELCFVHWRLARWISESFFTELRELDAKRAFWGIMEIQENPWRIWDSENQWMSLAYPHVQILRSCVCAEYLQLCLTLCNPMDCSFPGSSDQGDFPGKNTGMSCYFLLQGIFQNQGLNPCLMSPALAGRFFTASATWEAQILCKLPLYYWCSLGKKSL